MSWSWLVPRWTDVYTSILGNLLCAPFLAPLAWIWRRSAKRRREITIGLLQRIEHLERELLDRDGGN